MVFVGLSVQAAQSDSFIATIEAPGVQQTQSVFFSVGMETFDTRTTAATFTSSFSTSVGSFPLVSGLGATLSFSQINTQNVGDHNPPLLYGGAGGTGAYPKDNGSITINSSVGVNYFGLWVSAMNGGNTITIYRNAGDANALYTFTLSQMTSIVGSSSSTNLYYGNPNWQTISGLTGTGVTPQTFANQFAANGSEPYAFVNFYDTDGRFKYITIQGGGFESDNWTVGDYSAISGTNPAASDITSTSSVSDIGSVVNPKFDGGTLNASSTSTVASNFTITANNGTLNSNGFNPIYSGVFANASGVVGSLTIAGSVGSVTMSGVNTFTGSTTVSSGATLALSGSGSIASSSGLSNGGTFDISGTNSGASVVNMTGAGSTVLGSKTLTLTNGSGTYTGAISGAGGVTLSGGSKEFTGSSGYTGATSIGSGATLTLSGSGSISASSGVCNAGTLNISGTTAGTSVVDLTCTGNTVLGSKILTLTGPANTTYGGVASGTGGISFSGGVKTLEGINTYTGATTVASGATLKLTTGSIAASSGLNNSGTFDISGTTGGASLVNMTGSGNTILGARTLTLTNGSGAYSGAITGTGGLKLVSGTKTLSGTNTYSGTTEVDAGANLTITSGSAIGAGILDLVGTSLTTATFSTTANMTLSNNIHVTGDPTFNIAPGTTTTQTGVISGAGDVVVTGGGTFVMAGINTYTLDTTINSGSTLALSGVGSIAYSGTGVGATGLFNNGAFNVSAGANTIALGKNFTQSATGSLVMNWYQTINAAGTMNLTGTLSLLNAGNISYAAGRYTLLSSLGRTGTFSTFDTSALSSAYLYTLAYNNYDVYLDMVMNGPSQQDTQQSLVETASVLKNIFTLQHAILSNSFAYDCSLFEKNNVCASLGGRNTSVARGNNSNDNSGSFVGAYRPDPHYRLGIYAEQSLSANKSGAVVDLDPASGLPLIGLFGVWNERLDGTGTEVKLAGSYGQKKATVNRPISGGSEPGAGSSQFISQGAQLTVKQGFGLGADIVVAPYAGVRFSQYKMNGYQEAASTSVTAPLTFNALSINATTSLVGLFASYQAAPKVVLFAQGDIEADLNAAKGSYSASGVTGLTPMAFNANPVRTRTSGTVGASYYLQSKERLNIAANYREEPFQGKGSASVRASYDMGF